MNHRIDSYDLAWHPTNKQGLIRLKLASGQLVNLEKLSSQEFSVLESILRGHTNAFLTSNGWVSTSEKE